MAGRLGMKVDLARVPRDGVEDPRRILWSESLGRIVVTVRKGQTSSFEKLMRPNAFERIGEITADGRLEFTKGADPVLSVSVEDCVTAWKRPFGA